MDAIGVANREAPGAGAAWLAAAAAVVAAGAGVAAEVNRPCK